ncbi:MAG: acyl-CoA dehydrogenase family protein [Lachnospiraceae bacterium]|nr:acyl-CoA dehydrogenase family protein [Lachnospiraceae bacterium]
MTELQKELVAVMKEFGEKELKPFAGYYDEIAEFPMDAYKKAVKMGLSRMTFPVEYGGAGIDHKTHAMMMEELAKYDASFVNGLSATVLAALPVRLAGRTEQIEQMVTVIGNGGFAAFALTEANAGSDAASIRTTAEKVDGGYILNGSKCFITNGNIADIYVVFAKTEPEKGTRGISAFLVERNREGVSVGKHENKMGLRAASTSDVIFDHVFVPEESLIGQENRGFKLAMQTLNYSRIECAAVATGIAQGALEACITYAKERNTFGKPIASLQAIQFMLADMEIQVQAARALTWQAADLADRDMINPEISSCAKTFASDMAMKVTTDAVQIFGGYGYSKEFPVEKMMRDAKIYQIFEGTNQIQRVVISGNLLK